MESKQTTPELSFWQLMQKTDKIEIPIIQRDYAQGREGKEKIRYDFLSALSSAVDRSQPPAELDFVYGNIDNGCFQPLDGQQRLTTLFLLHWYAAIKENHLDQNVKTIMSRFTYETRISSREFCNDLVNKGIVYNLESRNLNELSNAIIDSSWFCLSWKKDPTIKAMLVMIDDIHKFFKEKAGLWDRLIDENNKCITFHYIELSDFGLSDDLYIKMNARGKQLTPFETFKAGFERKIDKEQWELGRNITDTFSLKADTTWSNFFWRQNADRKNFDIAYIRFMSALAINSLAVGKRKSEEKEKEIQDLFNDPGNIETENFDKDGYDYLYKSLDAYSENQRSLTFTFPFWQHLPKPYSSFISALMNQKGLTYPQRVLFFAQTEYLLNVPTFDIDNFNSWIRVVRNIVHNSTIDSSSTFIGAIRLVKELSAGCNNIYAYLSVKKVESLFGSTQVKEEVKKAKVMTAENQEALFGIEDSSFCEGRIEFILYCAGLTDEKMLDTNKIYKIKEVVQKHLNNGNISNEFRRALLTIGDNKFYNYWRSRVYVVDEPKRRLIKDINDLKEYAYNGNFRHYLKNLIIQLTERELKEIIAQFVPNGIPNWKRRLIQEPQLLDEYCQSHFVAVPDDESFCYLLNIAKPRNDDSCELIM